MLFNSFKKWILKLLIIHKLSAVICVTNPQTKAFEAPLNGKHLNVMWVSFLFTTFILYYINLVQRSLIYYVLMMIKLKHFECQENRPMFTISSILVIDSMIQYSVLINNIVQDRVGLPLQKLYCGIPVVGGPRQRGSEIVKLLMSPKYDLWQFLQPPAPFIGRYHNHFMYFQRVKRGFLIHFARF